METDIDSIKVLAVLGGSLPRQNEVCIRPVTGSVFGEDSEHIEPGAVFEQAPQYPPACDKALVYPHCGRFRVNHQIYVGTVADIVHQFEVDLRAAVSALHDSAALLGTSEQAQAYLAQVIEKSGGVKLPWDFDPITGQTGVCAAAEQARKTFKLPTTEVSDATTPSSDV